MKVLLRNHGLNLAGVKSNLYTMIGMFCMSGLQRFLSTPIAFPGLDSKHSSGIPSTVRALGKG